MMKKKKPTMAIFIDGNNFRHGLKALLKNENIDWKTFIELIKKDYKVVEITYYIGKITHPLFDIEKVKEQDKLLKSLKKAGIKTWLGYFNEDKHEKGVDVQIALDLAIGSVKKKFDTAILISGDGDLSNAVKIAQSNQVRVILGYIAGTKGRGYRISWILKSITDSQAALNTQVQEAHKVWKNTQKDSPNTNKKEKKTSMKEANIKKKSKTESAKKKTTSAKGGPASGRKKTNNKRKQNIKSAIIPTLLLFSDGACRGNPGPSGCGVVITDQNGLVIEKNTKYIGTTTNNQAEYQALLLGLETIAKAIDKNEIKEIKCYLDSKLIVEQVNNRWKVKKKELKPLYNKVRKFLLKYPNTSFHHIPREKNKMADKLANEAIDNKK